MSEFYSVRDNFLFRIGLDQLPTPVVVECWAHVETVFGSEVTRPAHARFSMDKNPAAYRG